MSQSLGKPRSHNTINPFGAKLVQAQDEFKAKNQNIIKIEGIENPIECADEVYTIVRVLFGDIGIRGFEDINTDYGVTLMGKIKRVHDFLLTQPSTTIGQILGCFGLEDSTTISGSLADEIKNLLDQKKEDEPIQKEAMTLFFDVFGGGYSEQIGGITQNRTLAHRFIHLPRVQLYIDNQREFILEHGMEVHIPIMDTTRSTESVQSVTQDTVVDTLERKISKKELERILKERFQELDSCIRRIPVIQSVGEYISLAKEVKKLEKEIEANITEIDNITVAIYDNSLTPRQEEQSKKRKEELKNANKILTTKVNAPKKQIRKNNTIITVAGVLKLIREYFRKEGGSYENSSDIIDSDTFESKKRLLHLFILSMRDIFTENGLGDKLWELVIFYNKVASDSELVTLPERNRFTPEYITSVFDEVYRKFPQLKL